MEDDDAHDINFAVHTFAPTGCPGTILAKSHIWDVVVTKLFVSVRCSSLKD